MMLPSNSGVFKCYVYDNWNISVPFYAQYHSITAKSTLEAVLSCLNGCINCICAYVHTTIYYSKHVYMSLCFSFIDSVLLKY